MRKSCVSVHLSVVHPYVRCVHACVLFCRYQKAAKQLSDLVDDVILQSDVRACRKCIGATLRR